MTTAELFQDLIGYTYWGQDHILTAATKVTQEQLDAPTWLDHESIQGVLVHQLGAEVMLRHRIAGIPVVRLDPASVTNLADLRSAWLAEEQILRSVVAGLTEEDLGREYSYTTRTGVEMTETVQTTLFQLINHATQHRSEVALALTQLGASPGGLDYALYARERSAG